MRFLTDRVVDAMLAQASVYGIYRKGPNSLIYRSDTDMPIDDRGLILELVSPNRLRNLLQELSGESMRKVFAPEFDLRLLQEMANALPRLLPNAELPKSPEHALRDPKWTDFLMGALFNLALQYTHPDLTIAAAKMGREEICQQLTIVVPNLGEYRGPSSFTYYPDDNGLTVVLASQTAPYLKIRLEGASSINTSQFSTSLYKTIQDLSVNEAVTVA